MMRQSQKNEERFFAKLFLRIKNCEYQLIDSEAPDFILEKNGERIALEVTRYISSGGHGVKGGDVKTRAIENWRRVIDEFYEGDYESKTATFTLIQLEPKEYKYPSKQKTGLFLEELAKYTIQHMPANAEEWLEEFTGYKELGKTLERIKLWHSVFKSPSFVYPYNAGPIGARPEEFYSLIVEKTKSAENYFGEFDEVIMLVYDASYIEAGRLRYVKHLFKNDKELRDIIEMSPFDAVYLLSMIRQELLEIYPATKLFMDGEEND